MVPEVGELVAGRYELLRPIGNGGMGTLWAARHRGLDCEVGLKFVADLDRSPDTVRRFEFEARAAARVRGRHVVHTYDFGFHGEHPFIVMELLQGENLAALMRRELPMAPRAALVWLAQLGTGLTLVHQGGVVHRDVKPSNLFIAHEGSERVLKLIDFGIAKSNQLGAQTASNVRVLGSPGYMSPEQARGQTVDTRSDLWSMAVVAYELVTGHALFASNHAGDAIARICTEEIPKPSTLCPALGPAFDALFARALARNPEYRFQHASEFVAAFERACEDVSALPPLPRRAPRGRDEGTLIVDWPDPVTLTGPLGLALEPPRRKNSSRFGTLVTGALVVGFAALGVWLLIQNWPGTPLAPSASGPPENIPMSRVTESLEARAVNAPHAERSDAQRVLPTEGQVLGEPLADLTPRRDATSTGALSEPSHSASQDRTAPKSAARRRVAPARTEPRTSLRYDPFSGLPLGEE